MKEVVPDLSEGAVILLKPKHKTVEKKLNYLEGVA